MTSAPVPPTRTTHVRYLIIAMLFAASCFSYGDRAALAVAAPILTHTFGPAKMGLLLSGFGWSYVAGQIPAGTLLDRFGSKRVYGLSILLWSAFSFLVGMTFSLPAALAFTAIFILRLLSGLAQSPVFPGNGRIVAAWFPTAERGRASAIFNASQYFSLVAFAPLCAALTQRFGWQSCFWFMGAFGLLLALAWQRLVFNVADHPLISPAEVETIARGGGLVFVDGAQPPNSASAAVVMPSHAAPRRVRLNWRTFRLLLSQRMLLGIYLGQFCINTLTAFFLTWFPSYLVKARHMTILQAGFASAVPALCGFAGGILGGVASDALLHRGCSLTFARKAPIVAGMLLSMVMLACNYTDRQTVVMVLMSAAFFGKGFGALGWTVIADASPRELIGVNGGVFNLFGNLSTITTPTVIGLLIARTGSFNDALVFVALTALVAIFSYVFLVGEIRRLELHPVP